MCILDSVWRSDLQLSPVKFLYNMKHNIIISVGFLAGVFFYRNQKQPAKKQIYLLLDTLLWTAKMQKNLKRQLP